MLPFDDANLDKMNYTLSLLTKCVRYGLVSANRAKEIKDIFYQKFLEIGDEIYDGKASEKTHYENTFVYQSVICKADVFLLYLNNTEKAVEYMQNGDFEQIIENGTVMILNMFLEIQNFATEAERYMLIGCSEEYEFVCTNAYKEFAENYSVRYFAKSLNTQLNYPLLYIDNDRMDIPGIIFAHKYYKSLMLENEFMNYFRRSDIRLLLITYGEINEFRCDDKRMNYCAVVFNNFLCNGLLGNKGFKLNISENEKERLYEIFSGMSYDQIENAVRKAFGQHYDDIRKHSLRLYLRHYIPVFAKEFYDHICNKSLEKFAVVF